MIRRTQHQRHGSVAPGAPEHSLSGVWFAIAAVRGTAASAPAQAASDNLITIQTVNDGDATDHVLRRRRG